MAAAEIRGGERQEQARNILGTCLQHACYYGITTAMLRWGYRRIRRTGRSQVANGAGRKVRLSRSQTRFQEVTEVPGAAKGRGPRERLSEWSLSALSSKMSA